MKQQCSNPEDPNKKLGDHRKTSEDHPTIRGSIPAYYSNSLFSLSLFSSNGPTGASRPSIRFRADPFQANEPVVLVITPSMEAARKYSQMRIEDEREHSKSSEAKIQPS